MAIPRTQVRTSHALTIRANGQTIGLINNWSPAQSRTVTPIFEVGADNSGNPVESMPGNMTGMTLNINRYDTYTKRMEEVFGTRDLIMLTRQSEPLDLFETWSIVAAAPLTSSQEKYIYRGCWFTSLGRTMSSDDNRVINVNATLMYTQKLKAQGIFGEVADFASRISF